MSMPRPRIGDAMTDNVSAQPAHNPSQLSAVESGDNASNQACFRHPAFAHLEALSVAFDGLISSLTDTSSEGSQQQELPFWQLIEIAQQFENIAAQRGLIDLHVTGTLLTPRGIEAAGTRNTISFLMDHLGISRREATDRVRAAELDGDIEPDGSAESLSPDSAAEEAATAPLTEEERAAEAAHRAEQQRKRAQNARAAQSATANGDLTIPIRADIMAELRKILPGGTMTAEDIKEKVYAELDNLSAHEIKLLVRELVARSNDTVRKPKDRHADQRRRKLFLSKPDADGCVNIRGTLDGVSATLALQLFGQYSKLGHGVVGGVEADKRTFEQRNADALREILKNAAAHAQSGSNTRGGLASLVIVANAADFADTEARKQAWWQRKFHTNVGTTLNMAQLVSLGLTDNLLLSLIDTRDGLAPIDMSLFSGHRIAGWAQRIALQILDGGCQHPGCSEPIANCEIHHIEPYHDGGTTDLANLVPLCRTHHRQNDDSRQARNRSHMCDRTEKTNFRSGSVRIDGNGNPQPPRFNDGPTSRQAPGYVPSPNAAAPEPPDPPGPPEPPDH